MKTTGNERGAALMTALIMLLAISLMTVSSVRLSMSGMRSAVNEEIRLEAFHRSQSLIDAVLSIPANTAVSGVTGDSNCLPSVGGCTRNTVALPEIAAGDYAALVDSGTSVVVRRLGPDYAPPPRFAGYSAVKFESASMQVESRYDDVASGGGFAQINEGVAVILPMPGG